MMLCNVGRSSVYFSGILRKSVPARFSYLNNSRRYFGSYIEDYYTTNHAATGFSSPLRKSFAFLILIAQVRYGVRSNGTSYVPTVTHPNGTLFVPCLLVPQLLRYASPLFTNLQPIGYINIWRVASYELLFYWEGASEN
eukprot:XP_766092.1 hypothetical protein [Theileria parva strain Muguga]